MNKKIKYISLFLIAISSSYTFGAITKNSSKKPIIESKKEIASKLSPEEIKDRDFVTKLYSKADLKKEDLAKLKVETLKIGPKAVPGLIEVMKNGKYPDKNRWIATFLLGRIMGQKAAPFVSKFVLHPHWVMRMASLKTLLALKQDNYKGLYAMALKDESFIVRFQALENISKLKIDNMGPHVWAMLYDKRNYYQNKKGNKRTDIIKTIVRTVGELKFKQASSPLYKMIQKNKYDDIFEAMDYALTQITGKNSPNGTKTVKRNFWNKQSLSSTII